MSAARSYAVQALVILLLEEATAEWTPAADLAGLIVVDLDALRLNLEELKEAGTVDVKRHPVGPDAGQIAACRLRAAPQGLGTEPAPLVPVPADQGAWNVLYGLGGPVQAGQPGEVPA